MANLEKKQFPGPTKYPHTPWLPAEYFANQRKFPQEELHQYAGQFIAFSWEGDKILASGDTEAEVCRKLLQGGIDPQRVVFSYVENL